MNSKNDLLIMWWITISIVLGLLVSAGLYLEVL